jgi:hypothetical protein
VSRQSGVHGRIEGETRPGARSSPSVSYHSTNEPVYYLFQAASACMRSVCVWNGGSHWHFALCSQHPAVDRGTPSHWWLSAATLRACRCK